MLFKILENDNTEESVKDAVALALIRTMAPRKMPKEIFRIAAFQIQGVSIHKKIVKYLKKVSKTKTKLRIPLLANFERTIEKLWFLG